MTTERGSPTTSRRVAHALIEAVAEQIAAEFQPERIVLFGSYAYGAPDSDSDVDLLVEFIPGMEPAAA